MKEIIVDKYNLKNPFEKSFFFDFSKNNEEITWIEKICLHIIINFYIMCLSF